MRKRTVPWLNLVPDPCAVCSVAALSAPTECSGLLNAPQHVCLKKPTIERVSILWLPANFIWKRDDVCVSFSFSKARILDRIRLVPCCRTLIALWANEWRMYAGMEPRDPLTCEVLLKKERCQQVSSFLQLCLFCCWGDDNHCLSISGDWFQHPKVQLSKQTEVHGGHESWSAEDSVQTAGCWPALCCLLPLNKQIESHLMHF